MKYITTINDPNINKGKVLLLIEASIQAYNAFDHHQPTTCQSQKIIPPAGFDLVECWSGVDAIFGHDKTVEIYGVVFRAKTAPYTYIFAFRGTASIMDVLDDLGAESQSFKPVDPSVKIDPKVKVEDGFYDVYSTSDSGTPSMQQQVFELLDKYQASDKPIDQLYITGHSLGAALSELFTLDVALSRPSVSASNINFASPRVGNNDFVAYYEKQPAQKSPDTRTIRVQNIYDKVPCVPPEDFGYRHLPLAYVIAFFKDGFLGKLDLIDCHSSQNYAAVLKCASMSEQGVCICKKLEVPANNYAVTSEKPDVKKICSLW